MEAALTADHCTLVANLSPFPDSGETLYTKFRAGLTLAEMLGEHAAHSLAVKVGGEPVPRALWAQVKPKAGQYIHATLFPQGGKARKWVAIIVMVVVSILTYGAAAGWFGATGTALGTAGSAASMALAAGISIVGNLLVTPMIGHAREILA